MAHRVYVKVVVRFDEEGGIHPLSIEWEDGRSFAVDRVTDVRRAASTKVDGQGIRYTCRIMGKETYLFNDDGRWFVEGKR